MTDLTDAQRSALWVNVSADDRRAINNSSTPWLDYLEAHIGLREIKGAKDDPTIVAWGKAADIGWWNNDDDPWCAVAVNGALATTGYKGTKSALARSFNKYGAKLSRPKRGAIVTFPRGTNPMFGHVGIVQKVNNDGTITIVDGNASNMVKTSTYRISSILPDGIRWPVKADENEVVDYGLGDRSILRRGMSGPDVEELQVLLEKAGLMRNNTDLDVYGPDTEDAVRAFQRRQGLKIDGIAGPATMAELAELQTQSQVRDVQRDTMHRSAPPAAAAGAAATVLASATGIAAQARELMSHLSGLDAMVIGALGLAVVGFFGWRWWQSRKAAA